MRRMALALTLGALLALPGAAGAKEPDSRRAKEPDHRYEMDDDTFRDHMDALEDLENAETEEEAEDARQRFDDAEAREIERRRQDLDHLIER